MVVLSPVLDAARACTATSARTVQAIAGVIVVAARTSSGVGPVHGCIVHAVGSGGFGDVGAMDICIANRSSSSSTPPPLSLSSLSLALVVVVSTVLQLINVCRLRNAWRVIASSVIDTYKSHAVDSGGFGAVGAMDNCMHHRWRFTLRC